MMSDQYNGGDYLMKKPYDKGTIWGGNFMLRRLHDEGIT